jgi:hypothetical protein
MKQTAEYRIHKRGYRIGKCRACEVLYQRQQYEKNVEKIRERKRVSMAKARAKDPEKARAYRNAYHATNREDRTAKMREYATRRFFWAKAMKLRGASRATFKELAALWKAQHGICALTGRRLDRTAQLDHKQPKAKGGGDGIDNLQWVCAAANLAKRDLTDADFVALCGDVMAWIGRRIQAVAQISQKEAA